MPSDSFLQKIFLGSVYRYLTNAIITFFGFLIIVCIVRNLSIEGYGLYNFLTSIILFAHVVTHCGLTPIVIRYIPEYKEKKNNSFQKRILLLAAFLRFVMGFIFVLILLQARAWIISTFNLPETFGLILSLVSLIILFNLESRILGDAALAALFENKYWGIARSIYIALKFFLFFLILKLGYGIVGIVWAWLIAESLLFVLFLIKVRKEVFSLPVKKEEIKPLPLKRFLKFGLPFWFRSIFNLFRDKATDIFILAYFLGQKEVGLYSFAFGIPLVVMSFSPGNLLRPVFTPMIVKKYTRDEKKEDLSYFFQFINRITFFIITPISLSLIILSREIIKYLFNPVYLEVFALFNLSIVFLMIAQLNYAYTGLLYALEKTRIVFIASWVSIYNLGMDLFLIPKFGVLGAILATGSTGLILLPYYYFALKKDRRVRLKYPWKSFVKFTLNTLPLCGVLFLSRSFIRNVASLILVLVSGAVVYLIFSYLNKGFEDKDRDLINRAIGRKAWVF